MVIHYFQIADGACTILYLALATCLLRSIWI